MAFIDKPVLLDLTRSDDIFHSSASLDWRDVSAGGSAATEVPVGWCSWKCKSWQTEGVRYLRKTKWGNLTCSIIHLSFSIFTSELNHKMISKIRFHNSMIALVIGPFCRLIFEFNMAQVFRLQNHDFDPNLSFHKTDILSFEFRLLLFCFCSWSWNLEFWLENSWNSFCHKGIFFLNLKTC